MELSTHTARFSAPMMPPPTTSSVLSRPYGYPQRPVLRTAAAATFGRNPPNLKQIVAKGKKVLENGERYFNAFKRSMQALANGIKMLANKDTRRLGMGLILTYGLPALLAVSAIGTHIFGLIGAGVSAYIGSNVLKKLDQEIALHRALNPTDKNILPSRHELTAKYGDVLKRLGLQDEKNVIALKRKIQMTNAHHVRELITTTLEKVAGAPDKIKDALRTFNEKVEIFFGEGQSKTLFDIFHLGPEEGAKFNRWHTILNTRAEYFKSGAGKATKFGMRWAKSKWIPKKAIGIPIVFGGNLIFIFKHGKTVWNVLFGKAAKVTI